LKYIIFTPHLGKGGAEKIIVDLANNISSSKTTLFVFFNSKESSDNLELLNLNKVNLIYLINLKSITTKSKKLLIVKLLLYIFSPLISLWIYFKFKIYTYNIVHINMTMSSFYSLYFNIYRRFFRKKEKYVETFHTNRHLLKFFTKKIFAINWRFIDLLVYEIGEDEFKDGVNTKRKVYIPFSIDPKRYKTHSNDKSTDIIHISTLARVRRFEKKLDLQIELIRKLKSNKINFKYYFAGDGEDLKWLKSEVIKYSLSENVVFLGYVKDISVISSFTDLMIVTVVNEKSGIAGLESMLSNIPIIGIQTLDRVDDSYIFNSKIVDELFNFIKILHNNSQQYVNYKNQQYKKAQTLNDFNGFIEQYENEFKKIFDS
tara:strand:+ start:679 stop:1797 length:1119 start_codon:yes stop_codon:yes gene_type:complete